MYSKLPREVLEQIFTHPDISKKDLLQLQLTCKLWSPVAQKQIYKKIWLQQDIHIPIATAFDIEMKKIRLLIRTLLLSDVQIKNQIKTIDIGNLFDNVDFRTDSCEGTEEATLAIATLVQLCPNITALSSDDRLPSNFYDAALKLHRGGSLQKLQYIDPPQDTFGNVMENSISSYKQAIHVFRDTIKEITIFGGTRRFMTADDPIQPSHLQHFPRVEHMCLKEDSRIHLFRFKDYISNCCPNTKSINIDMAYGGDKITEYHDTSTIIPQNQIQHLSMILPKHPMIPNEMECLMRMFPRLQSFTFMSGRHQYGDFVPVQPDMEMVIQLFNYLLKIPRVNYQQIHFVLSEGLSFLPHLAKSIDIQHLFIAIAHETDLEGLAIALDRETVHVETPSGGSATIKTKRSSLTVKAMVEDTDTFFRDALEPFKNKPTIKSLTVGLDWSQYGEPQEVNEELVDNVIDNFPSLQELTYRYAEFPSTMPQSKTLKAKRLRCLHLYYCQITEDYYTKLSTQVEHVNHFIYTTSVSHEVNYNEHNGKNKIRIHLPYTTINTIELAFPYRKTYTIKVLTKFKCYALKLTYLENSDALGTLEACDSLGEVPKDTFQVLIHCMRVKTFRVGSISIELPSAAVE